MKDINITKEQENNSELMQNVRLAIQNMDQQERVKEIARLIPDDISEKEKTDLGRELRRKGLPAPTDMTTDFVWKVTIGTFAFVLCGSFIVLAIGIFQTVPENSNSLVSGDLLLSIFTAAVGFFAGIFAPSPGKND